MSPQATLRSELEDPDAVARAVRPDNTPEVCTRVEDDALVTTIERETTRGLRSTVDDYVVNVLVAQRILQTTNHE